MAELSIARKEASFPLLSLPPEIRNYIYRHMVLTPHPLVCRHNSSFYKEVLPTYLDLFVTCRQIFSESGAIFYAENTFKFYLDWPGLSITDFHQCLPFMTKCFLSSGDRQISFKNSFVQAFRPRSRSVYIMGLFRTFIQVLKGGNKLKTLLVNLRLDDDEAYLLYALAEHLHDLKEVRINLTRIRNRVPSPGEVGKWRSIDSDLFLPYLEKAMMSSISGPTVPRFLSDETDETAVREWIGDDEDGKLREVRTASVMRAFNMQMDGMKISVESVVCRKQTLIVCSENEASAVAHLLDWDEINSENVTDESDESDPENVTDD